MLENQESGTQTEAVQGIANTDTEKVLTQEDIQTAALDKKLSAENAEWRRKFRDAEKKITEYEAEKLTDTQKKDLELKQYQEKASQFEKRVIASEIKLKAAEIGINSKIASDLIQSNSRIRDLLSLDENGEVVGVDEALKMFESEYPELIVKKDEVQSKPGVQINSTNPSNQAGGKAVYRESQLRDHKFWKAHKDDIELAVKENRIVSG